MQAPKLIVNEATGGVPQASPRMLDAAHMQEDFVPASTNLSAAIQYSKHNYPLQLTKKRTGSNSRVGW